MNNIKVRAQNGDEETISESTAVTNYEVTKVGIFIAVAVSTFVLWRSR